MVSITEIINIQIDRARRVVHKYIWLNKFIIYNINVIHKTLVITLFSVCVIAYLLSLNKYNSWYNLVVSIYFVFN